MPDELAKAFCVHSKCENDEILEFIQQCKSERLTENVNNFTIEQLEYATQQTKSGSTNGEKIIPCQILKLNLPGQKLERGIIPRSLTNGTMIGLPCALPPFEKKTL